MLAESNMHISQLYNIAAICVRLLSTNRASEIPLQDQHRPHLVLACRPVMELPGLAQPLWLVLHNQQVRAYSSLELPVSKQVMYSIAP